MRVKLPNGLLDGQDLFNYVHIDELRGAQQDYLADRELVVNNIGHVPKILEDLVLSFETENGLKWQGQIKDAIKKIPQGDLDTILIKIREKTYGPRFYHSATCTHCGHTVNNLRLDLDKLEIKEMSVESMLKPKTLMLDKEQKEVEFKPLYMDDLFKVLDIGEHKTNKMYTEILSLVLKRIGDDTHITPEKIGRLPITDLHKLNAEAEKLDIEGDIDTDIYVDCPKCKKEYKVKLNPMDPDFFDHTKGSTTTTT